MAGLWLLSLSFCFVSCSSGTSNTGAGKPRGGADLPSWRPRRIPRHQMHILTSGWRLRKELSHRASTRPPTLRVNKLNRPVNPPNHHESFLATRPSTTSIDQGHVRPVHHISPPTRPQPHIHRQQGQISSPRPLVPARNVTPASMRKRNRHLDGHGTRCKTLLHLALFQAASTARQWQTVSRSKRA